ncbi:MAG TPA: hypothetical protein VHW01_27430 [Polyangiaceae bacterium]|nr:hypothetical protein [Polyangiaceae bacterium]
MQRQPNFLGFCAAFGALPLCLLVAGCGGGSDGGGGGVLSQAPNCPAGSDALKIEGTVAGAAIDDERTTDINAGYENIGMPEFNTPLGTFAPLPANQLTLEIDWSTGFFNGQTAPISGGAMTLPANHPDAGAQFCISAGTVGIVDGGSEDGAFKFDITQVKAGADCSGAAMTVDLRGCFQ